MKVIFLIIVWTSLSHAVSWKDETAALSRLATRDDFNQNSEGKYSKDLKTYKSICDAMLGLTVKNITSFKFKNQIKLMKKKCYNDNNEQINKYVIENVKKNRLSDNTKYISGDFLNYMNRLESQDNINSIEADNGGMDEEVSDMYDTQYSKTRKKTLRGRKEFTMHDPEDPDILLSYQNRRKRKTNEENIQVTINSSNASVTNSSDFQSGLSLLVESLNDIQKLLKKDSQAVTIETRVTNVDAMTELERKVISGSPINVTDAPYQVAYGYDCGGAILHKQWVITVAHCKKHGYIMYGTSKFLQGTKMNVLHHHVHPMWYSKKKENIYDYDLQLLHLESELPFSDSCGLIKIGFRDQLQPGLIVNVTGWGYIEDSTFSTELVAVKVPVVDSNECQETPHAEFRRLTERMFCAGIINKDYDICQGDTGSPAVAHNRLYGLVSYGRGCAKPGMYGLFSSVVSVRPWIQNTMRVKLD